ncbi:MAG TPA: class I SAM-dependent methyltransferase [Streptosporangiaceae bacterium]|nr:class I SAM-dependent methyltransferase [Streptosporangiaceae bacterium]
MIYQHPLAYLLGLEGLALLRAFNGEYDREFTMARIAEIRTLLDSAEIIGDGAETPPVSTLEGYAAWAADYDQPGNRLIDLEQPVVRRLLDGLPRGTALDAACGTGRHGAYLASLGHVVIGVDSSAEMLAVARASVPQGVFLVGDLLRLPVPDEHVDLVVCSLALTHVHDLRPVFAEFVRVLRPGGHVVISDSRNDWPVVKKLPDGRFGYLPHRNHLVSDYLAAALPLGLQVRACEEPRLPYPTVSPDATPPAAVEHPSDIWSLQCWCPAAANAAAKDTPIAIVWHFQLSAAT